MLTEKTVGKNVGGINQNYSEFPGHTGKILLKFGFYWLCGNVFFYETVVIKAESLSGM